MEEGRKLKNMVIVLNMDCERRSQLMNGGTARVYEGLKYALGGKKRGASKMVFSLQH